MIRSRSLARELERGETDRCGNDVVRGLPHVHVILGRDQRVRAARVSGDLVRQIRDDLVDVHVVRHAGAGLERIDDKLLGVLAGEDLVAGAYDRIAPFHREPAGFGIGQRRRLLDQDDASNERRMRPQATDAERFYGPLRPRTPQRIGRDTDLTERVLFYPESTARGAHLRLP